MALGGLGWVSADCNGSVIRVHNLTNAARGYRRLGSLITDSYLMRCEMVSTISGLRVEHRFSGAVDDSNSVGRL
jgi:hypothetical protein